MKVIARYAWVQGIFLPSAVCDFISGTGTVAF